MSGNLEGLLCKTWRLVCVIEEIKMTAAISTPTLFEMKSSLSCERCECRLNELKRQAVKYMMIEYHKMIVGLATPLLDSLPHIVYKHLRLHEPLRAGTSNGICADCGVHVEHLKKHALLALQTINFTPLINSQQSTEGLMEREVTSCGETTDSVNGSTTEGSSKDLCRGEMEKCAMERKTSSPNSPTAAQFFQEAAKKFNIPKQRKAKKPKPKAEGLFPTDFSKIIDVEPPANPPGLFKYMGRRVDGKVSVMLRISRDQDAEPNDSFIAVDQRKKHVSVIQPRNLEVVPQRLQSAISAPKLFAFDSIFEPVLSQNHVCASALLDVLHAVINGGDGCLLSYGAANVGKTSTMVGNDSSNQDVGIIPSAIAWLYSLIEDSKQRTGARISVRVSAVEVVGNTESLKDLLSEQASTGDSADSSGASPGIYLREDPVGGTIHLGNVTEPQAVSGEKAAFLLDAALAARTNSQHDFSHMIFTIHVYQYRVDKNYRRGPGGAVPYSGGRSRLHLIDLSYVSSNFDSSHHSPAPSHAGLGQIIVAMLNGFKQLPYRDSKITRLLKDSIGNPTCRSTLIAHVSEEEKDYSKTFNTLQLVSKVNKSRRKKNMSCSSSNSESSCDESRRRRPHPAIVKTYGIDDANNVNSDYNTSSAGEDSCDTVIYMGGNMSDRDLSDNEHPPSPAAFRAMKLKLASSSEDENPDAKPMEYSSKNKRSDVYSVENQKHVTVEDDTNVPFSQFTSISETTLTSQGQNVEFSTLVDSGVSFVKTEKANVFLLNTSQDPLPSAKKEVIPPVRKESLSSEKAVNVVAPLIVKNGPLNSVKTEAVHNYLQIPTDKDLRRQEKRIEKLFKNGVMECHGYDGYKSDTGHRITEMCEKISKLDGYISAPENYKHKPVQVVRGTVRQSQTSVNDSEDDLKNVLYIPETDLDQPDGKPLLVNATEMKESSVDSPNTLMNNAHKIQNLDHIITVSKVPNFAVAKRPLCDILASPKLSRKHMFNNNTNIVGSLSAHELKTHQQNTPVLERSYFKEDTCSLISVNDSDAYDSDAYSSSTCTASPVTRRRRQPTRLKYRWSTLYEEVDVKKNEDSCTKKKLKSSNQSTEAKSSSLSIGRKFIIPQQTTGVYLRTPKSERKLTSSSKPNKKFYLLSPKAERKLQPSPQPANRMSACSDTSSSGIGSVNSQSPSLKSEEEIAIHQQDAAPKPSKSRKWIFSRLRSSKKPAKTCGYASDGNFNEVHHSRRIFGSKSKSSLHNEGHSSGYDTSVTEYGTASCTEDFTDTESVGRKKKKRFLVFRRRSTNDLSTRGRTKKPLWLDNRRCQSDDEGVQLKVYEIDEPNRRRCKSYGAMPADRTDELRHHGCHLKNGLVSNLTVPLTDDSDKDTKTTGKKLKGLRSHIQVVTCFDAATARKTTRI